MTRRPAAEVSIVIPTRDRAGFLGDCLATVLGQRTDRSFEVVVVDNGSTDATPDTIDRWRRRDPRVRGVREERVGRACALNAGIAAAEGSLLLFTDDDVYVQPGWIDAYVRLFDSTARDLAVAGGAIHPVPLAEVWPDWFAERAARSLVFVDWGEQRALAPRETVWGANMAVPASVFRELGAWDESTGIRGTERQPIASPELNEDIELQERVRRAGGAVWFCAGAVVHHRTRVPGPRRVLAKGFGSGRNEYRRAPRPGVPRDRRRGARSPAAILALASALGRLGAWSAAVRLSRLPAAFERAWLAAWAAGWRLEDLLADERRDAFDRSSRRIVARAKDAALRLVPARG
jgi:GT2 family glycosyltransferase